MARTGRPRGSGVVPLAVRFFSKVSPEPNTGCWLWSGAVDLFGYGRIHVRSPGQVNAAAVPTHRVAWEIKNGPIPSGLFVLHRCDNPPCVNPAHLFLGTAADNLADMDAKGRRVVPDTRGERNSNARLTARQAAEIRAACEAGPRGVRRALAVKYRVSRGTIDHIARGQSWAHLEDISIDATAPATALAKEE
jgi:hypothetical protein